MVQTPLHFPENRVAFVLMSLLHLWWSEPWTKALDIIDRNSPELTCTEGLRDCKVTSVSHYEAVLSDPEGPVNITCVDLNVVLCCTNSELCVPCLQVIISLTEVDDLEESGDSTVEFLTTLQTTSGSGQLMLQEPLIKICFSSPGSGDFCKTLQFAFSSSNVTSTHELLLRETAMFGSLIVVRVLAHSKEYKQQITIPSLEKVCLLNPEGRKIKDCDAPSLNVETDHESEMVRLRLENIDKEKTLMCQMMWDETVGETLSMPKDRKEISISLNSVAPCLCFLVWWKDDKLRRKYCPFKNQQVLLERMQRSVSLALMESPMRRGNSVLIWNVSAPCRLKVEVWLCKREVVSGACQEVMGSRQRVDGHDGWVATHKASWKTGEFNIPPHPLLCLQIKLDGIESHLDPYCPFAVSRWRWIVILLFALLLVCLSILGACCIQRMLKGYAWRWAKDADVRGAVGSGHVVLLYPPDDEQALPGLMCHLGSSLQALGCSVSLDLWSHAELSVLGPVPWLHSRLDQLQRQGGKVVLVLTQAARRKAEQWGASGWEKFTPNQKDIDTNSTCVDVFSASLSCILADYLQGRAGERFMLVQFESLPPEGVCQPLPELFRGLHVYSLPSQSLGFLTELAGARQMATSSSRRKRAHRLRMASRALARGLSGFTAGTAVLRLAAMPQSCVGTGEEDLAETMPLQPYLLTPPSSPDTNPKISQME
uniref:SEFIR domain-containing protein n=1 Tax=Neogobius melanostomus TaxID=47308 RepID=A0A8C6TL20_9GOBI